MRTEANDTQKALARYRWPLHARPEQRDPDGDWAVWLILAGRGFGKTRTGAEWVREQVRGGARRIGLIAPTFADVRDIMVEGESGILAACWNGDTDLSGRLTGRPVYESTRRRVRWKNGAVALMFSAEEPERLRGPQHEAIWCDELAAWRNLERTWDVAQFGLRLGERPRTLVTTTPKPLALLRRLMDDKATVVTRGRSADNAINLAPGFVEHLQARYAGTPLGRQELDGELVDERAGALWTRRMIDEAAALPAEPVGRIVVAIDPPAGSGPRSDACGIVAAGLDRAGRAVVLADESARGLKPQDWAMRAVALYRRLDADCLLAEVNQGGDMVATVIRSVDPALVVKTVRASRAKWLRAEPVAMLYAGRRVRHAGRFPDLEDEMCDFGPGGLSSGRSPDRLDALVWAVTELVLGAGRPRIRDL